MASGIGKELKRIGSDTLELGGGIAGKKLGKTLREGTSALGRPHTTPPPPTVAPPPAEFSTAGRGEKSQLQKRKGASSTRRISRTPLGGGASLT